MLTLEYYSPPLPNVACPKETARIELKSLLFSPCKHPHKIKSSKDQDVVSSRHLQVSPPKYAS